MAGKRKLTDNEAARVREHVVKRELARYPGFDISVKVKKKTDDSGAPRVVIKRTVETTEAVTDMAPHTPVQNPPLPRPPQS